MCRSCYIHVSLVEHGHNVTGTKTRAREKYAFAKSGEITPENLHYLLLNFLCLVWRGLISLCNICEVCSILNFLIAKEFVQRFVKKSL